MLYLLLLILSSCRSSKPATDSQEQEIRIGVRADIPIPGSFLSIGHGLTMSQTNEFRPFSRTVRDTVSKTSLHLQLDSQGYLQADCQSDPDTVTLIQYLYLPKPIPCPEPEKPPKEKSNWHIQLIIIGIVYLLFRLIKRVKTKEIYDRFKTFISGKFRK